MEVTIICAYGMTELVNNSKRQTYQNQIPVWIPTKIGY